MKQATWDALEKVFARTPVLVAGAVPIEVLHAAEKRVGVKLPEDFQQFVARYGGAVVVSLPILGLRKAAVMGSDYSFVDVTEWFRRDGWTPTAEWVVISVDLGGNPIGINDDGEVWISDHDAGEVRMISPTFEGFVELLLSE